MPFDTNFLELMNSSVDWYPYTGEDVNGNPTYGAAVNNIPSLYEGTVSRGSQFGASEGTVGRTPEATYVVYVPPPTSGAFRPRDKLILDNGAVTYARMVNVYQDPSQGDPGLVQIETEEYR